MDPKIIVKEPCLTCSAGKKSATIDNTKAIETINRFKAASSIIDDIGQKVNSIKEKHSFAFLKAMHTVVVTQDINSENLIDSIITDCPTCDGQGHVEKTFNMADAFTTMLTAALQDPNFAVKNADLLKKLTSGNGST